MLILPTSCQVSEKNNFFEKFLHKTPNELMQTDEDYQRALKAWKSKHAIKGNARFFEVRVIRAFSPFVSAQAWYTHPLFMDKVFWVFQEPEYSRPVPGKTPIGYYSLERHECLRVFNAILDHIGKAPWEDPEEPLIIPVDNVQLCWEETSAGVSDHIRNRPEPLPMTNELDHAHEIRELGVKMRRQGDLVTFAEDPNLAKKFFPQGK